MKLAPFTQIQVKEEIAFGIEKMTEKELNFWHSISIEPEKWQEFEYGIESNGFWVVAICKDHVIWYNDIEEGFNISDYTNSGLINVSFG
jgi:hypothetical protein